MKRPKTGTTMNVERRSNRDKQALKKYHRESGKKAKKQLDKLKAIWNQDVVNRHINNDHMRNI